MEAEEAAMMVAGSHNEVALFVPVGRIVSGCVGAKLDVEVARLEMICVEEAEVAVAITVPLLEVVTDAIEEADVAKEPESVVRETVPELVGLVTAVELTEALEIPVDPDVVETVTLVVAVVAGVVAEAMVLLLVGGTAVEMPVSLLVGGAEVLEVTTLDAEVAEDVGMTLPEVVGVTVLPTPVVDEGADPLVVVTGTELLVDPNMLEMMLPRSVVGLDVGLETGASEVVVEIGTPVEAAPLTPEVDVGAEPEFTDDAVTADKAIEVDESVEVTEDAGPVEVGAALETTDETSEVIGYPKDNRGSVVDVGADGAALESVADALDATESVPVVVETAEDATL